MTSSQGLVAAIDSRTSNRCSIVGLVVDSLPSATLDTTRSTPVAPDAVHAASAMAK